MYMNISDPNHLVTYEYTENKHKNLLILITIV